MLTHTLNAQFAQSRTEYFANEEGHFLCCDPSIKNKLYTLIAGISHDGPANRSKFFLGSMGMAVAGWLTVSPELKYRPLYGLYDIYISIYFMIIMEHFTQPVKRTQQ